MKNKFILAGVLGSCLLVSYITHQPYQAFAQRGGITGVSGSPGTQQDCGTCHFVSHRTSYNMLHSDIPEDGYLPDQVYNFTLHIRSQKQHAGFNIRPENTLGEPIGTIIKTDSINSTVSFLEDEITHANNMVENGGKQVHFKWKAPSKGSGIVAFYTALGTGVVANTDGLFMDSLNLSHVKFQEAIISESNDGMLHDAIFKVIPTMTKESFMIEYSLRKGAHIELVLQNEEGKVIKDLSMTHGATGSFVRNIDVSTLPEGIYLIKFQSGHFRQLKRVIVSK